MWCARDTEPRHLPLELLLLVDDCIDDEEEEEKEEDEEEEEEEAGAWSVSMSDSTSTFARHAA